MKLSCRRFTHPIGRLHPFSLDFLPPWYSLLVFQQWAHTVMICKYHPVFLAKRKIVWVTIIIYFTKLLFIMFSIKIFILWQQDKQYIIPPPSHHSLSLSIVALAGPGQHYSWESLSHQSYRVWRNDQSQKLAAPKSFLPALHMGSGNRGYYNVGMYKSLFTWNNLHIQIQTLTKNI